MSPRPASTQPTPWTVSASLPDLAPIEADCTADACIVGAGIAGLTTAYLLAARGRSVVVLDDGPIACGMTAMTTAHLVSAIDDRYYHLERLHGEKGAALARESHCAAIDRIGRIVEDERIDCGYARVPGHLFLRPEDDESVLDRELQAAARAGFDGVEKLPRAPDTPFDTGPCLRFPRQGQFHPLRYLAGVARAIGARGGRIFTGSHASEVAERRVVARGFTVSCDAVVVATNSPVNDLFAIHTKMAAYMTYVVAARIPKGSVTPALWWTTGLPYHYVRVADTGDERGDLLLVGGEDHRSGQEHDPRERYAALERWARERFPMAGDVAMTWGGQVMETLDGLAYIGRNPGNDRVFVATGDSGMGMTHGTIAGMVISDLVLGRANPWAELYEPSRKSLRAGWTYASENAATAAQYADWLRRGDVSSVEEIPKGAGAVVARGAHRVACYRDGDGALHEMSAACPHLGCVVQWNPAAATWDCPCHGSRFDPLGTVVNGPANRNLGPAAR